MSISKRFTAFLLAMIMAVGVFSFTASPASAITDAEFVAPNVTIPDFIPQPNNDLLTNNVSFLLGEGTRYEIQMKAEFIDPSHTNARPGNINYQKYIVVHNTGNYGATATAWANHNFGRNNTSSSVSWHYTCGNDGIYQTVPVNERAWHAGGNYWTTENSVNKVADASNSTGIGIETATPGFPATGTSSGGKWNTAEMYEWYETVYDSTATYLGMLVAWLCVSLNFNPYTQIVQHHNTAGKNCPEQMRYVFGTNATFVVNGTYYKVFKDRMFDYYKAFGGGYTSSDTLKNQYYNPNKTVYKKGLYKSTSAVTVYRGGNTATGSVGTVAANTVMDVQTVGFNWGRVVLSNGTAGWVNLENLTYVTGSYRLGTYRTSSGSIVNVTNISGTTAYYEGGSTAISNLTKVYKVTVKGDTAFGSAPKYYAAGEKFTVTAAAPTGTAEFDMWELTTGACTFADKTASTTTVTVKNSDIVMNASYRSEYILTVTDGLGGGRYKGGTTVQISASGKAGYEFAGWELVSGTGTITDPLSYNTTFTMGTSDATVKATYKTAGALDTTGLTNYALGKTYTTTWKGSSSITYYSTTQGDSSLKKLTDGTKATAAYSTADSCYTSFTSSGSEAKFTINLGTTRNIRMIALCDIANNGGSFGDVKEGSIVVEYSTNGTSYTALTITDTLLYSYSGGSALSNVYTHRLDFSPVNASYVRITFTSGAYCTSISEIEVYGGENTAALTVQNGTGSGTYAIGKTVSISASSPGEGYEFKGWTIVSGNGSIANASAENTTFTVAVGGATIKANYELVAKIELNQNAPATIEGNYLKGVTVGKSLAEIKGLFKYDVTVTTPDGKATTDASYIGTGYVITAGSDRVEVVVTGDLNSDASVNASDFIVLKQFLSSAVTLEGAFDKASDCDNSGAVSAADYIALAATLKA